MYGRRSPASSRRCARNSAHAISATAPPPTPLNSATICGIAVIFTLRAAGTPTAVPIATPSDDQARSCRSRPAISSVAIDRDRHADRRDPVAAHRRLRAGQPAQAEMNRMKATM